MAGRNKITTDKACYCHTCEKEFHHLGIMSHRAMHRRNGEDCEITFTYGDRKFYEFSDEKFRRSSGYNF